MALAPEDLARAVLHFQAGRLEDAVGIAPLHEIENAIGTDHAKRGDNEAAERHYRRAIALHPGFFKPHNNLANVLRARGERWAAVEHYREALRIEPSAQRAHANLGNVLVELGLLLEAADAFKQAVALKAGADVMVRLGAALEALGETKEALAVYRRAAELGDATAQARGDELARAVARFGSFGREVPPPVNAGTGTPDGRRRVVEAAGDELGALLAPLTPASFVREFWAKKPLFLKGFANKYRGLFDADAFVRAVAARGEPNTLRANFDKKTAPARSMGGGPPVAVTSLLPVTSEQAGTLFDAGATICVSEIEVRAPELAPFLGAIRRQLGYPGKIAFNAYASPPGGGFNWHFDGRVASTLQIEGTKRWRFSRRAVIDWPQGNGVRRTDGSAAYTDDLTRADWERLTPLDETDVVTVILEPGDLLILPAGVWHEAEAGAAGSMALNLAFLPLSHTKIVEEILDWSLASDPAWRGTTPLFRPPGAPAGGVDPEALALFARQLQVAADTLREVAADSALAAEVWGSFVQNTSRVGGYAGRPSEPVAPADRLRVRAAADVYARAIEGGSTLLVWVGRDRPIPITGARVRVVERMLDGGVFVASDCAAWAVGSPMSWADTESLLGRLLAAGLLEKVLH